MARQPSAREKTRRSRRSKAKGYRGEVEFASFLGEYGYRAKRKLLSGATVSSPGDVWMRLSPTKKLSFEVKRRAGLPQWLTGWLFKSRRIAGVAMRQDGRGSPWLLLVRADSLMRLMQKAQKAETHDRT